MKILLPFIFISLLPLSMTSGADPLISIDSLNYPVWIERENKIIPLAPGDQLNEGDLIKTGSSGRAWLSMQDGSVIKLGQDVDFKIKSAAYAQQANNSVLKAALDVVKGAFRFTTSFFSPKRKTAHQVNIKIGAITAGLRSTDIWGRASDEEDFVALLDGSINISAEGQDSAILSAPLSLYVKKRHRPAEPISSVDLATVQILGAETELSEELGIARIDGEFEIVLMSFNNPDNASRALKRFHLAGYAVEAMKVETHGIKYTRIVLKGLISNQAATNLFKRMEKEFSLQNYWILKRSL